MGKLSSSGERYECGMIKLVTHRASPKTICHPNYFVVDTDV